ncbi:peptide chain release factor N(5)-glutamine methyltransferase [Sphingomonas sp. C3-2]|uniref:peptide chain release factor N(5)-glutamine methyltransferase n=1 Tax=Sphingomonas sp. C3-2 TaxID=3062169 RepID=UPI003982726B
MRRSGLPVSLDKALRAAAEQLALVSDTPRLDAEILLAHALGISRQDLLLGRGGEAVPPAFDAFVQRRAAGEPIAYIVGARDFWSITLKVAPGVLIPRPDSETLIEAAVAHFGRKGPGRVLDLGTGPGTLLLAALAEWPEATGLGIDASDTALALARENAEALGLSERAEFRKGDWAVGLDGPFDLILCNPPYIGVHEEVGLDVGAFEPPEALFAGEDGLDDYRVLANQIPPLLAPEGLAAIEIGHAQRLAVSALFAQPDLALECRQDLGGHDRAILLRWRGMHFS